MEKPISFSMERYFESMETVPDPSVWYTYAATLLCDFSWRHSTNLSWYLAQICVFMSLTYYSSLYHAKTILFSNAFMAITPSHHRTLFSFSLFIGNDFWDIFIQQGVSWCRFISIYCMYQMLGPSNALVVKWVLICIMTQCNQNEMPHICHMMARTIKCKYENCIFICLCLSSSCTLFNYCFYLTY